MILALRITGEFLKIPVPGPTPISGPGIWDQVTVMCVGVRDNGTRPPQLGLTGSVITHPLFQSRSVRVQACHHQRGSWVVEVGAEVLLTLGNGFLAAKMSWP